MDLRPPAQSEARLIAEAREAGATFPPTMWRDYFTGASPRFPMQFEAGYVHAEDFGVADIEAAAERARAKRDAFLDRLIPGGDLHALVVAIDGGRR